MALERGSTKKQRDSKAPKGQVPYKCFNRYCQQSSEVIHPVTIKCNPKTEGKEFLDPAYKQFKAFEWACQQYQLKEPANTENFLAYLCEQCKSFFDKGFICYYCKQVYAEEFDMDQMGWVQCDVGNCGKWVIKQATRESSSSAATARDPVAQMIALSPVFTFPNLRVPYHRAAPVSL